MPLDLPSEPNTFANPPTGYQSLYLDSSTNKYSVKTSTGIISPLGGVSFSGTATTGSFAIFSDTTGYNITSSPSPLGIGSGGTGSTTQNFVDLTSAQTIAGTKTFSSPIISSGASLAGLSIPNTALAGPLNGWIDVSKYGVSPSNSPSTNSANLTALIGPSGTAPSGSTLYFPGVGTIYQFNTNITIGPAQYTFQGQGAFYAGGYTILQQTANVGGLFTLTSGYWYTSFNNLVLSSAIAQTSGAAIITNNNVSVNLNNCQIQSTSATNTWFDAIQYIGSNSGNSAVLQNTQISGFTNYGLNINSVNASLVVVNSIIQGQYGSTNQHALANIYSIESGAIQIDNSDILGANNNMLLIPPSGNVVSSTFVTNTYFDAANGSCIKISGAGATVRTKFSGCSFTTGTNLTNLSAVECSTTYSGGAAGLDFNNCNVLNTFGTTGTTYGFNITGASDISINNCRVAGWTNGIAITPIAGSLTAPIITNTVVGPSGGFSGNTNGITLNPGVAGPYGAIIITSNNLSGNTTNIIDNSSSSSLTKVIGSNAGGPITGIPSTVTTSALSTTETVLATSPCGTGLLIGSTFLSKIFGTCTSSAANLSTFTLRYGTTGTSSDAAIGTMTATAAATGTAVPFFGELLFTVRTIGTTGTIAGFLAISNGTSATTGVTGIVVAQAYNVAITPTSTLNTTLNGMLSLTYKSAATTTATTFQNAVIEVMNAA